MAETAERTPPAAGPQVAQAGEARDLRIESLRALAALGVVVTHSFGFAGGNFFGGYHERLLSGIGFGGFFFFTLSGCLLYTPFVRRDFGGGRPIRLPQYGLNRALRVFPLYFVVLVVVLVVFEGGGTFDQWWRYGLFWQNFSPNTINTVNGSVWTVAVELHFFLLLPVLAWLVASGSGASLKRAALVLGGLGLASMTVREYALANPQEQLLLRYNLPSTFHLVAAGMLLALLRVSWENNGPPAWVRGPFGRAELWVLGAIPLWMAFCWNYKLEPLFAVACFLALGACVLPLRSGRALRFLEWRTLGAIGLASYSIYLWHIPLLNLLTDGRTNVLAEHFVWLTLLALPLSILVALGSYRLVEERALRLRRRWGSTGTQPPATAGRIVTSSPSSTDVSSPSRKRMSSPPT